MATAEKPEETSQKSSSLASLGLALSDWFERWFPDAFALALAAAATIAAASMLTGSTALETAQRFGAGEAETEIDSCRTVSSTCWLIAAGPVSTSMAPSSPTETAML